MDANVALWDSRKVSAKPTPPKKKPAKGDLRGTLAWHVRTLRVAKGWSQEALAHECGLDRTYVSAIERSLWNVALSNIERLAKALDVEPWELIKPVT
ncbi:helix-turn-helix domain-containing protein [Hydrogenophaga laconesensis]|uniref:Ribosome-binding protein aMBF1 (Putative translation factor) n=1 Tax=Hydrogenophaga laconesensis TaxID=1805971 RepID=A0ABU1V5X2_9BURK|nr:ribosome-binding protein aMBF1 (putative translation factor) [Hydrogenophaga laconesensis]